MTEDDRSCLGGISEEPSAERPFAPRCACPGQQQITGRAPAGESLSKAWEPGQGGQRPLRLGV